MDALDSRTKRRLRRQAGRDAAASGAAQKRVEQSDTPSATLTPDLAGKSTENRSLHPKVAEIVCDHANRPGIELIDKAISAWITDEYFPIHLKVEDFDTIAKSGRKLRPSENAVLYVLAFMESEDEVRRATGTRLWIRMMSKNISLEAKRHREQARLNRELERSKQPARKKVRPYAPIQRYELVIPDNGRDPDLSEKDAIQILHAGVQGVRDDQLNASSGTSTERPVTASKPAHTPQKSRTSTRKFDEVKPKPSGYSGYYVATGGDRDDVSEQRDAYRHDTLTRIFGPGVRRLGPVR
jgi:hypothetical protein